MKLHIRIFLSVIVTLIAVVLGFLGAFIGSKMVFWMTFLFPLALALALLPWKSPMDVIPSQENLVQDTNTMLSLISELKERESDTQSLIESIGSDEILTEDKLEQLRDKFRDLRSFTPEMEKEFREFFFAEYRRTLVIMIFIVMLAAFGGAVIAAKWSSSFL